MLTEAQIMDLYVHLEDLKNVDDSDNPGLALSGANLAKLSNKNLYQLFLTFRPDDFKEYLVFLDRRSLRVATRIAIRKLFILHKELPVGESIEFKTLEISLRNALEDSLGGLDRYLLRALVKYGYEPCRV